MEHLWSNEIYAISKCEQLPEWSALPVPKYAVNHSSFRNVIALKSEFVREDKLIKRNVFDSSGLPIVECDFHRGKKNIFRFRDLSFENVNSGDFRVVKGTTIYLGWLWPHYGHFIMESLSILWIVNKENLGDFNFYFNIYTSREILCSKKWFLDFIRVLGLDFDKIYLGDESFIFENFVVPEQAMILHRCVDREKMRHVWGLINSDVLPNEKSSKLIYLSRSKLLKDKRKLINEIDVENLLLSLGFEIIHPQELSFSQQLILYKNVSVVVGPSGSALHNAAFMRPGVKLISLTTKDFMLINELLCCYASGVKYSVFCGELIDELSSVWSLDIVELKKFVISVMYER